ncbi:type I restriction-modification system subunit M [Hansschlegelia zhihuaiae]|uniref:SAM-dependent DNA methyltransferase n=1 Tax=Hansschlegelia zhihuaiae TaxID=405005 RepID=A0A4Q0MMN4_9HYPH|nr:type I restriction-modification system subunit M [Hansschlegelia zhihuaiae]RXF75061.1 SAM-dependent DNA methyltransferase [Hansschlegelia zhihuaiae]
MTLPRGARAIMASRREPPTSLDFFPTPPWATRALVEYVLEPNGFEPKLMRAWDPCCGEGHMAETLKESFGDVEASDIFDYGRGYRLADVLETGVIYDNRADLVITNPPFNIALDIALAVLSRWRFEGLFLLMRTSWLESEERYRKLFSFYPPDVFAPFVERVPMVKGRYDPKASSATSYAWIGWMNPETFRASAGPAITFIPPCRKRLETKADIRRWCAPAAAPLFDGAP